MRPVSLSLRGSLSLIVTLMGIIGLCLAILTGEIYRQLMLDHERKALSELVQLEASILLREHHKTARDFALSAQKTNHFQQHVKSKNIPAIQQAINEQFSQYYVTAGVLDIIKVYIYDKQLQLLAESATEDRPVHNTILCGQHVKQIRGLTRVKRLSAPGILCEEQEQLYSSMIVPIHSLAPVGYLQIITNPLPVFTAIESALGLPIQIRQGPADFFESSHWPDSGKKVRLESDYTLLTESGRASQVSIGIKRDITEMEEELNRTRIYIIFIGGLITAIAVAAFLFLINRSALSPLSVLSAQLRKLRDDKSHLGEKVELRGNNEIQELTSSFNAMTTELSDMYKALEEIAFRDELTSLPNRSRLQEILTYHTRQNQKNQLPFALFMMDLDHFKAVNDTLGHHAGDVLLQQVSERLSGCLRKTDSLTQLEDVDKAMLYHDMVARLGGDEFAAVLPTVARMQDAIVVAEKIQKAMEKPFEIEACNFSIGISIGIVLCPEHGNDSETLMRRADVAMYQAKSEHVGAKLYDPSQDHHSVEMLTLGDELKKAIERDELELYYQPKVDLQSKTLVGVEALLRWQHPQRGFIPPDQFVAIAEQTGLIHALTQWVINTGMRTKAEWQQARFHFGIAINLSTKNLLNSELILCIQQALMEHRIPPKEVTFEITETTIMSDPKRALEVLEKLYQAGIDISIDDFGTGYSSLSYLKKLPVSELKIDRSFVMDMLSETSDAILVHSIIDLARNMSLRVIAEGIEDLATLNRLTELGCNLGQGYHIAKPMPSAELLKWLQDSEWRPSASASPDSIST